MTTVISDLSMSLDGFVADPSDGVDQLHKWFFGGAVTVPTANPNISFQTDEASAGELRGALETVGALISGRRNFDIAGGWGGNHPMGAPAFIVTHDVPQGWPRDGSSISFVTEGIETAVARAKAVAGDKIVAVASPSIVKQCLEADLLDAIRVSLVPVLLGDGIRYLDTIKGTPIELQDPTVVQGDGVTHLHYRIH